MHGSQCKFDSEIPENRGKTSTPLIQKVCDKNEGSFKSGNTSVTLIFSQTHVGVPQIIKTRITMWSSSPTLGRLSSGIESRYLQNSW